eukprot:6991391-Pyramimonas_sp.AAC.1
MDVGEERFSLGERSGTTGRGARALAETDSEARTDSERGRAKVVGRGKFAGSRVGPGSSRDAGYSWVQSRNSRGTAGCVEERLTARRGARAVVGRECAVSTLRGVNEKLRARAVVGTERLKRAAGNRKAFRATLPEERPTARRARVVQLGGRLSDARGHMGRHRVGRRSAHIFQEGMFRDDAFRRCQQTTPPCDRFAHLHVDSTRRTVGDGRTRSDETGKTARRVGGRRGISGCGDIGARVCRCSIGWDERGVCVCVFREACECECFSAGVGVRGSGACLIFLHGYFSAAPAEHRL